MKSKQKRHIYVLMIGFIILLINTYLIDFHKQILNNDKITEETSHFQLKRSGYWVFKDTTIIIDDTPSYWPGSINWSTAATQDWCSGTGTISDPYVIENITMIGYEQQACIWIMESNAHFIIRNCTFMNAGQGLDIWDSYGRIINNTFMNNSNGVSFSYCQDFVVTQNKFIENNVGLGISQGDNYTISENSFKHNRYGLEMVNDVTNSLIYANNFQDNSSGIYLFIMNGVNNNFSSNMLNDCGFSYYYDEGFPVWAQTTTIETTNLVNNKSLYFYYNQSNLNSVNFTNAGQVLLIQCNNSQISDLNISNCNIGIYVDSSKNNTITNSNFTRSAIYVSYSKNITVNNNIVSDHPSAGIALYFDIGCNLTNNKLSNCGYWIGGVTKQLHLNNIDTSNKVNKKPLYFYTKKTGLNSSNFTNAGQIILVGCEKSYIRDLNLSNCYTGIMAYNCNNNTISNISSSSNQNGLSFDNCSNNRIFYCHIRNCYYNGMSYYNGKFNLIKGCTFSKCGSNGLSAYGDENIITENIFENNIRWGIRVSGDYNNITNNKISNNFDSGLSIANTGNVVLYNNITHNRASGVEVTGLYHYIAKNNISNNEQHGIRLENANENTILDNEVSENKDSGIFLSSWCDDNDIFDNDFQFNDEFGIFLHDDTNFNTIYRNNFTENQVNAEDNGILNVWDNGIIGNYWDDYVGNDTNDDGIGDTPYTNIGGNAGTQDDYPIWWDPPAFSIISPIANQMIGGNAPGFIIEIDTGVPDSMWYTLDILLTKYFFISNSTINQGAWDLILSDTVTITFYINDSAGLIVSNDVSVKLDKINPIIIINSPYQNEEFSVTAPSFNVIAIDDFLDEIWYTLDGGITNHSCGLSGQIDQILWDILPGGTHNLRFYASDTNGNVGFSEVTIIKTVESVIPGFDLFLIFLTTTALISLISIMWYWRKEIIFKD
ncbi:MAG: NosD domain-containing protein [Promethearchaeota archaeon]